MKPLNSYLVCKDLESNTQQTGSGFEVKTLNRFRKLQVVESSEEDIQKGDVVKVSVNAGEPDEGHVIIKRSDVVYIV